MTNRKFHPKQRLKLKDSVTVKQNSKLPFLKGKVLIVDHYTHPFDHTINCNIENEGSDLYSIEENLLEEFK